MLRERLRLPATLLSLVVALAAIWLSGCGGDDTASGETSAGGGGANLTLVAYSTPREVYEKLIPAFQATDAGKGVEFEQSYAASGEQSRAVEAGLPADYVAFSLAPDVDRLVKAGLIAEDWTSQRYRGMVSDSVVVLIVRPGNPKGIAGWDDLLRDDVEVLTPNVFTSGGAKWNTMAAYGAQLQLGKTPAQAEEYLAKLYANVSVQDKSARESLQTFLAGKGDVLLGYENEAILAKAKGEEIDFVVPDETLLIENPAAVVTSSKHPERAQAWLDFVQSPEAQKVFGEAGYRPVDPDVAKAFHHPRPGKLFTIDDLGGWSKVNEEFFDRDTGVVAEIFTNQGKALE
ncbi:MAG: sulfate ABC transporter substrate-binding protein [Thermoleophilia bacterium]|nr:sulfate ABC transporter substrate-binding protein [Thermoleophilia bacterium]